MVVTTIATTSTTTYTISTSTTSRQGSRWDVRADDPSIVAEVKNARVKEEEEQGGGKPEEDEEKKLRKPLVIEVYDPLVFSITSSLLILNELK